MISENALYRKMLVTPRLNLLCDGVKLRLAYVSNESGNGWMIENLNGDGKTEWLKGSYTKDIVKMLYEKFNDIKITWSRSW